MEAILDLVFQLYRAAQDAPPMEFQDLALTLLEGLIPFCGALWFAGRLDRQGMHFLRIHSHGLAPDIGMSWMSINRSSPQPLSLAARAPRRAHSFHAPQLYTNPRDRDALDLSQRHRLERQLVIADIATPSSEGEWLALFRPEESAPFVDRELQQIAVLMPHFSQALALTRALNGGTRADVPAADRALVRDDGTVLHCGTRLAELIRAESPEWNGARLPAAILRDGLRGGVVHLVRKARTVEVTQLGEALLLTVRDAPLADRLSPQELNVARLFGTGASYKEIARRIALSPATVRNVVQNAYRKLGINNKAQLARLMAGSV